MFACIVQMQFVLVLLFGAVTGQFPEDYGTPPTPSPRSYISWDMAIWPEPDGFHDFFCNATCVGGSRHLPPGGEVCNKVQCFPCRCDWPLCQSLGICCVGADPLSTSTNADPFDAAETEKRHDGHQGKDDGNEIDEVTKLDEHNHEDKDENELHGDKDEDELHGNKDEDELHGDKDEDELHGDKDENELHENDKIGASPSDVKAQSVPVPAEQIYCDDFTVQETFLAVRSCPESFLNESERGRCENYASPEEVTMDSVIRVNDRLTGVIYYNTHCARCNRANQDDLTQWNAEIDCDHYMNVYTAVTADQFLQKALQPESDCDLYQETPDNTNIISCESTSFNDVISTCNVSGLWAGEDLQVQDACESLMGTKYLVRKLITTTDFDNPGVYRNIFCAMCNSDTDLLTSTINCDDVDPGFSRVIIDRGNRPFTLLLGGGGRDKSDDDLDISSCSNDTWASPDGLCLPLRCAEGKVLHNQTSCTTALTEIRGLAYKFTLWLVPHPFMRNSTDCSLLDLEVLNVQLVQPVHSLITSLLYHGIFLQYSLMVYDNDLNTATGTIRDSVQNNTSHPPFLLKCECSIFAGMDTDRDVFERQLVELAEKEIKITVGIECNTTIVFDSVFGVEHMDIFIPNVTLEMLTENQSGSFFYPPFILPFSPLLLCAWVEFNSSQYQIISIKVFPFKTILLTIGKEDIRFSLEHEMKYINISDTGDLRVCSEFLDSKVSAPLPAQLSDSLTEFIQYVLSLVCVSVSMACLLVTLVTYAIFPTLRNVAGKNNMHLSLSLFVAQLSLLITVHLEPESPTCVAVGLMTHYFWLCTFCWSFICCLRMFRVFTASTRSMETSKRSQMEYTLKSVLFAYMCPMLVVISVVVFSLTTSDGQNMGYEEACYLNSAVMVGIAMVGPLGLLVICNIVFFAVTVYKIHNVRKLQQHRTIKKDNQKDLYVYVKLSSLTGSFWLLAILGEVVDNDILRFIYIVLNGLQGVFIFCSYICNQRVLGLYLVKAGVRSEGQTYSSSGRTTLSTVDSQMRTEEAVRANNNPNHQTEPRESNAH